MTEKQTRWISKGALTAGVRCAWMEGPDEDGDCVIVSEKPGWRTHYRLGRDCHETREEAVKAAEAARVKKIASLEKQIEKLRALDFGGSHD